MRSLLSQVGGLATEVRCYELLLEGLRPVFDPLAASAAADPENGQPLAGWVFLLTRAAEVTFQHRDVATASRLVEEAWRLRPLLRLASSEQSEVRGTRALARIVTLQASAIRAVAPDKRVTTLEACHERLHDVRRHVLTVPDRDLVAMEVMNLAIAIAQLWVTMSEEGGAGWLEAATEGLGGAGHGPR